MQVVYGDNLVITAVPSMGYTSECSLDSSIIHVGDVQYSSENNTYTILQIKDVGTTNNINFDFKDRDCPNIENNTGIILDEGDEEMITDSILSVTDIVCDDENIEYTVTSAPVYGQIENISNAGVAISTFTQGDIDNSKIKYVHDDSNSLSDSFDFKVEDDSANELTDQTFSITINQVDDDVPTIIKNLGSTLADEDTVVINNAILQASDTDSNDSDLIYSIVIESLNGGIYNNQTNIKVSTFTQGDIDSGYIEYRHTGDVGDNSFVFTVTDGTNTTVSQTFSINVSTVYVTGIELESECETWNVSTMDTIGYAITPSNSTNQVVTWSSSNLTVTSVESTTGMITANAVGVTTITVTANDTTNGTITDTCIIKVVDSTISNPSIHKGNITGTLVDDNGLPLAGYNITLYSNPVTVFTDSAGGFVFTNMPYDNHTLVVSLPTGTEIGRFALDFVRNNSNSSSINNANNRVTILHTDYTTSVKMKFQTNITNDDIDIISDIGFVEVVVNPETGY